MYYRCELLIGGMTYDATNELVNWDDVEMSFKRGDYDGVVRSFSTKNRRICNYLRIKRLFGLHGNWVTR